MSLVPYTPVHSSAFPSEERPATETSMGTDTRFTHIEKLWDTYVTSSKRLDSAEQSGDEQVIAKAQKERDTAMKRYTTATQSSHRLPTITPLAGGGRGTDDSVTPRDGETLDVDGTGSAVSKSKRRRTSHDVYL